MLWEVHHKAPTIMHCNFLDHQSGVVVRLRKSTLAKVWHNLPEADPLWLPSSHFLRTSSGFVLSVCGGKRWLNEKYADSSWATPDHKWFKAALALSLQSYSFFLILHSFFFKFYFIFKLYIIVLVLPNIKMNPPQVYMCSPSWTLHPPPSPYHPSGSSQCTSPKHPVSCIEPGLATRFIHDILHVSIH